LFACVWDMERWSSCKGVWTGNALAFYNSEIGNTVKCAARLVDASLISCKRRRRTPKRDHRVYRRRMLCMRNEMEIGHYSGFALSPLCENFDAIRSVLGCQKIQTAGWIPSSSCGRSASWPCRRRRNALVQKFSISSLLPSFCQW
jgi:hypothetical protein